MTAQTKGVDVLTGTEAQMVGMPMVLPVCTQHGQMVLQHHGTKEQEYCGIWYRCTRCGNSTLFPSADLRSDLDRAALARVGGAQ